MTAISSGDKYPTAWQRLCAAMIDGFIFLAFVPLSDLITNAYQPFAVLILWLIVAAMMPHLYSVLLHKRFGQTFGKMIMKIKVVDISENAISFRQAVLRESLWFISGVIYLIQDIRVAANPDSSAVDNSSAFVYIAASFLSLIFAISFFANEEHRMLHDLIAKTVVIKTNN